MRSTSYVLQSLQKKTVSKEIDLTPEELSAGEKVLFHLTQRVMHQDIENTKKRFHKLSLVQDEEGLIQVKGRLERTNLPEKIKHPILLSGEHAFIRMFATYHHRKFLHQGYRVVLPNILKLGIMIGNGMELLKSISSRCIFCRIRRRKLLEQRMED